MDTNENIIELRLALEALPIEAPPEMRRDLLDRIEQSEWRETCFAEIRGKILAIVDPKFAARGARIRELRRLRESSDDFGRRLERELEQLERRNTTSPRQRLEKTRYADREAQLFHWCAELKVDELLDWREESQVGIRIPPSPGQVARLKEAQQEHDRLMAAHFAVLNSIADPRDRAEARRLFNVRGGALDDDKLSRWIQECNGNGLFGKRLAGAALIGALVARFLKGEVKHVGEFFR